VNDSDLMDRRQYLYGSGLGDRDKFWV
jgi:hypothetical protein